eukprot:2079210-Karenia_brevis.AAC.1
MAFQITTTVTTPAPAPPPLLHLCLVFLPAPWLLRLLPLPPAALLPLPPPALRRTLLLLAPALRFQLRHPRLSGAGHLALSKCPTPRCGCSSPAAMSWCATMTLWKQSRTVYTFSGASRNVTDCNQCSTKLHHPRNFNK